MIEALHLDDVQQALESLSNWRLETTPNHHIVREWSGELWSGLCIDDNNCEIG